jgi:hypothetical protein
MLKKKLEIRKIGSLTSAACLVALALLIAGCGSSQPTITITSAEVSKAPVPVANESSVQTAAATAAAPNPAYPVVHWTEESWKFGLQLVSITKNPQGFQGRENLPPGKDWLMVRVNITNEVQGRSPAAFPLEIRCGAPTNGSPEIDGFEQVSGSNELVLPSYVGLGSNEPHTWGAEWEVPESTNTSHVTCGLEESDHQLLALN